MSRKRKVAGQWRDVKKKYRKVGGKWRQVAYSYKKVAGQWRQIFAAQYPIGLYELNTDNLVGSYDLRIENGAYVAEISGYNRENTRNVIIGFRLLGIPATMKVEYNFSAQASSVNATFQVWNNTELVSTMNGGSGGGSIFYANDHVDFTYAISANASSGPVTAKFTINGITVDGVAI